MLEAGFVEGEVGAAEAVEVDGEAGVGVADGEDEWSGEGGCGAVDAEVVVYARCGGGGGRVVSGGVDLEEEVRPVKGAELWGLNVMGMEDG